ncbi:PLP-dependent cysteine synthase family protein [Halalkalirubrum salinum]|uniref:PLP-dependent cysteine synthase family protein n=1 Tax=Halalkalirubrum salinum TaxID=2563889 RepID=UPI0010FB4440|nr:cysteine synthase family protein [Halalkalirubrum salinum]
MNPYNIDDPVLSLIGQTSLVEHPKNLLGDLHLKLEKENPTGSMKDRIGLGMILEMRESGEISDGDLVIEASSGNTAGAVALAANRLGHDSIITTPEKTSPQKMGFVKAFGSELVTCPDVNSDHKDHYRAKAQQIADKRGGIFLNQYHNQLNPKVHEKWTGPELWNQTNKLTHIVCPMGTGGTLSGIGKYIKNQDPSVNIIGVDAKKSNISTSFYDKEPVKYDTKIEGLGKGGETPTMWFDYIDEIISVKDEEAIQWAKKAAREDGLLIGTSAGAAFKIAYNIANENENASVVSIVCDGGEQYFDTLNYM